MTTIVMVEHETGVDIGYDSLVSTGPQQGHLEAPKVFVNGGLVFGVAGAVLDAQILKYAELPDPTEAGWDVDRWVTTELIPAAHDALYSRNATEIINGKLSTDSHILAVIAGRVYRISYDGAWVRLHGGFYAVGSGSPYALGALSAGATVREAIEVAASYDKGTGYDITINTAALMLGGH